MRGPASTAKNGATSTPRWPSSRSTPAGPRAPPGSPRPAGPRTRFLRAAQPGQYRADRLGVTGGRIARRDNAVGDADPPGRPGGEHRHAPTELGLLGDLGQVVGAGLQYRHPPGQELIAGEVAVVVGVRGRRCDVVGVDQVDHVAAARRRPAGCRRRTGPRRRTPRRPSRCS